MTRECFRPSVQDAQASTCREANVPHTLMGSLKGHAKYGNPISGAIQAQRFLQWIKCGQRASAVKEKCFYRMRCGRRASDGPPCGEERNRIPTDIRVSVPDESLAQPPEQYSRTHSFWVYCVCTRRPSGGAQYDGSPPARNSSQA